ncbi:MAG: ATP-binding protein [Mycobacteriales bacterium]
MLGSIDEPNRVVVADFEAGLGTLTRLGAGAVDLVLVVAEPSAKSLEVATRAAAAVEQGALGRVEIVANRLRDDADLARIRAAIAPLPVHAVPEDPDLLAADREGRAALDQAPDAPAVRALVALAQHLLEGVAFSQ